MRIRSAIRRFRRVFRQPANLALALWLGVSAAGCSRPDGRDDGSDRTGLREVEVTFEVGTERGTGASESDTELAAVTFVPDGGLLPRSEPSRVLLSSNNWQQVNDVRIYTFRRDASGAYTYYRPLSQEGTPLDYLPVGAFADKFGLSPWIVWWGGADDRDEAHRYVGRLRLDDGAYRFLALARDDGGSPDPLLADPNRASEAWNWPAWTEGSTRLEEATLACKADTVTAATELFVGCTADPVVVEGTDRYFTRSLTLERAVAGILLYVENIPAEIEGYDPDTELPTGLIVDPTPFRVVSLAVVHGAALSDQVRLADRAAVAGRLAVSTYNYPFNPPTPAHTLLKIDIPASAAICNGVFVDTAPDNVRHPNSLLCGAFAMPQQANVPASSGTGEEYDKSLYLVFYGRSAAQEEFALAWRPIRLAASEGGDPYYYPLLADHFYSIGHRNLAPDGSTLPEEGDEPIDLTAAVELEIRIDPFWNEYYGGEIGDADPGVGLDPDWGDHPAGNLKPGIQCYAR